MNVDTMLNSKNDSCLKCYKDPRKRCYFSKYCLDKLCEDCYKNHFVNETTIISCSCKKHFYSRKDFTKYFPYEEERKLINDKYLKIRENFSNKEEYDSYLLKVEDLVQNLEKHSINEIIENIQIQHPIKLQNTNKNKKNHELKRLLELCNITNPMNMYLDKESYFKAENASILYDFNISEGMLINFNESNLNNTNIVRDLNSKNIKLPVLQNIIVNRTGNKLLEKEAGGYIYKTIFKEYSNYALNGLI